MVRLLEQHWPAVRAIYAAGIVTGHATFETEPPSWEAFDAGRLPEHRFVAEVRRPDAAPAILGWVVASPVSDRCAYSGVVEDSVYVDQRAQGRGVGRRLLAQLIASTEAAGIWTIQSGIFPENTASLALHHALGFRTVGIRERLGRMASGPMAGQWRDVVLVERRAP